MHPTAISFLVVVTSVVVSIGHPSKSLPCETLKPSKQQPYKVILHIEGGHPSFLGPAAGDIPSAQQLYSVSLQVCTCGQPRKYQLKSNLIIQLMI